MAFSLLKFDTVNFSLPPSRSRSFASFQGALVTLVVARDAGIEFIVRHVASKSFHPKKNLD
jgi:hypothetical protein